MAAAELLFLILSIGLMAFGNCALESVPDLDRAMYKVIDGTPCIRLINMYGEFGCANPGRDKVVAPVRRLTSLDFHSEEPVTLLVPYSLFHLFLEKTRLEPSFAAQVAGVLLEYDPLSNLTVDASPDSKFPQAEFAPYSNKNYQWNPSGTDVLHRRYNFPVYLLSQGSTKLLQEAVAENQARNTQYPVSVAEFDVVMQTTTQGTHTSESCLKEWSCLPLGGYSVLSALPQIDVSSTVLTKPILLVMTAMDSASFFRESTPGADSPLSGLIALLAAVDALSKVDGLSKMNKQVVFLICNGEAWSYLGSRRFLLELETGGDSVSGLNASNLHQILEVGSVGRAIGNVFYAHSQDKQAYPRTREIFEALKVSAESLNVKVKSVSEQNPGVPPSSIMPFLQKNASLAGVVLEDFDTKYSNNFYHSHLDNAGNVYEDSILTASSIVARTVYQLAHSDSNVNLSDLESIIVNTSLVKELIGCLLTADPGMECGLVKSLISPTQVLANHYVGVFLGSPSASPFQENLDDTTKFVWNFLADRTKKSDPAAPAQCTEKCKDPNQICVGATAERKGSCAVSTTRYVPAYSTRLQYKSGSWKLLPVEAGDLMDSIDPVWTESFWKSLTLRVYLRDNPAMDRFVFFAGCCITFASAIAIVATQALFRKRLKSA